MRTGSAKLTRAAKGEVVPAEPGLDTAPQQPFHGTRGAAPGPRGCWAVKKDGTPCASPKRGDSDFCTAHSGIGVAADPKGHAAKGLRASIDSRRNRAELRLLIGNTRLDSPRSALRAAAFLQRERLARRAVNAALDPELRSDQAVSTILSLVEAVDPRVEATLSTEVLTPDGVSGMSYRELLSLAESQGIA